MKTIVSVSGGLSSYEALRRVVASRGRQHVVAVFADVKGDGATHAPFSPAPAIEPLLHERYGGEARDLYRFLWRIAYHLDVPIVRLEDEQRRTVWRVLADAKMFWVLSGRATIARCSEELKRQRIARWIEATYTPGTYEIALGMDIYEAGRIRSASAWWQKRLGWPVRVYSPLMVRPYPDSATITAELCAAGIEIPRAYVDGFEHNNCNGICVLAGQKHYARLYRTAREVYLYAADKERQLQRYWNKAKDNTILAVTRGGVKRPVSLHDFVAFIESGQVRTGDGAACACFTMTPMAFLADVPPEHDPGEAVRAPGGAETALEAGR